MRLTVADRNGVLNPFRHIVVDEPQDGTAGQFGFLATLGVEWNDAPFSFKFVGVDVDAVTLFGMYKRSSDNFNSERQLNQ